MNIIRISTDYRGSQPLKMDRRFDSYAEARANFADMLRQLRRDLNVIVFREAPGSYFVTTVNGAWEGTRELICG